MTNERPYGELILVCGLVLEVSQGKALYFETLLLEYGALYDKSLSCLYGKKITTKIIHSH